MPGGELDPALILRSLGVTDAGATTPVSGGYDTAIWRVQRGSSVDALRVFRPGQGPSVQRELLAMRTAAAGGIPVPFVRASSLWQERPVMLLSWLPGHTLAQEVISHPWRLWPLGVQFGRMQAAIHAIPASGGMGSADWISLAGPDEAALQERLRDLPPRSASLLHLDFHPLNVLTDGRRITAVLDWTNALPGDPRADAARTFAILCMEPMPPRRGALLERYARLLLAQAWRHGYEQVAGATGDLSLFYAWAGAMLIRDLWP
ncbi:MAG TPA: aminoglycoside phosphotransferase family protein, partial [Chloroflexota bacterium]